MANNTARKAANTAAANTPAPAAAPANGTPGTPAASAMVSPVAHTAPAHKYGANAANVACAHVNFALTAAGAAPGAGSKTGKPTVWQAVIAAARAAGASTTATANGLAIVQAMQTNPQVLALLAQCRATKYVARGVPCAAWCNGYVTGAARNPQLYLAAKPQAAN